MKKIYRTVKYVTVALLAMSLTNCNDDLTTRSSVDVDEDVVISSTTGLNMALTSAYHYVLMGGDEGSSSQNDICYAGVSGLATWFDAAGEDIVCFKNYGGSQEDANYFAPDRTRSNGAYAKRIWGNFYKIINQCNVIIDALPEATGSEEDKQELKGQALTLRGLSYFVLLTTYQQTYAIAKNKRGVILRTSSSDPSSKAFSTVEEGYQQVISDLSQGASLLSSYERSEKWRVNADVANGYLARAYQVMGDWSNAYNAAKTVYDKYSTLMSESEWCSGFDNMMTDNNPELIWGVKFTNVSNIGSNTIFNLWYNQDPSYGEGMTQGPIYNFINFFVDQKFVDMFDDTDYRGTKCTKTSDVTDADEKGVMFWHRTANGDTEVKNKWAYNKFKYYGDADGAPQGHTYPEVSLMRSSEMLLIMAEAEANLGNTANALSDLNKLQQARNVSKLTTTTSQSDLLEAIYKERRKELLGEGVTGTYDLLRLQKPLVRYAASSTNPAGHFSYAMLYLDGYNGADAQPTGTLPSNDYRFINQIPELELTNNDAISQSDQNPFSGQ